MEENFRKFITVLYDFLKDLNRYCPTAEVKTLLNPDIYQNLPMGQICLRYYTVMKDNAIDIENRNEKIFDHPLIILPDINISKIWFQLSKRQKNKIWTYLNILYKLCDIILNSEDIPPEQPPEQPPTQPEQQPEQQEQSPTPEPAQPALNFNPYEGIGVSTEKYGIKDMFSGPETLPGEKQGGMGGMGGMGDMAGMLGLSKMFNVKELKNQLRNMSTEEIDAATKNLKDLLGSGVSDKTSGLISNMLTNITDELKKTPDSDGDGFDDIMKIAETVANNLQPQIERNKIDMSELLQSTEGLTKKIAGQSGAVNPFSLVNTMMGNLMNRSTDPTQISEQDCINECTNILQQMGMAVPPMRSGMPQQPQKRKPYHPGTAQRTAPRTAPRTTPRTTPRTAPRTTPRTAPRTDMVNDLQNQILNSQLPLNRKQRRRLKKMAEKGKLPTTKRR